MDIKEDYQKIIGRKEVITGNYAKSFRPKITQEDINRGHIKRFFAKPRNNPDGLIVEISEEQLSKLNKNYYNTISLRWRIKGPREEVEESNSRVINQAEKEMANITFRLGNLFEFYSAP